MTIKPQKEPLMGSYLEGQRLNADGGNLQIPEDTGYIR